MKFFNRKSYNTQPEMARLTHRAIRLAKLAEVYNISLSDDDGSEIADLIAEIPDSELEKIGGAGTTALIGCPAKITPFFAGYSQSCVGCMYFNGDGIANKRKKKACMLNEK